MALTLFCISDKSDLLSDKKKQNKTKKSDKSKWHTRQIGVRLSLAFIALLSDSNKNVKKKSIDWEILAWTSLNDREKKQRGLYIKPTSPLTSLEFIARQSNKHTTAGSGNNEFNR